MTKTQLAQAAGVSRQTLWRWMRDPYIRKQIDRMHIPPNRKTLPSKAVKFLCEHYVIDLNENN